MTMVATNASLLESLPNELLLAIASYLEPKYIARLQLVSKRLLKVCRDNVFWRMHCYAESSYLEAINLRRGIRFTGTNEPLINAAITAQNATSLPLNFEWKSPQKLVKEQMRVAANWDPTYPKENVNWYDEYIQRNGPIAVNWFEQPRNKGQWDIVDVKGVATFKPQQYGHELLAVSPLDDGSVCLWDVKGMYVRKDCVRRKGSIVSKSKPGLLSIDGPGTDLSKRSKMISTGVTECVSIDSYRKRAYFAVQSHLLEVDLQTMQLIGNQPYEWPITTLSAACPTLPLTVGTFHGIHLQDSRLAYGKLDRQERIDLHGSHRYDFSKILSRDPLPPYAPLAQSGPLTIHHLERPGMKGIMSDDIFVAGRFSSILHYDRRMFPAIKGSIHSGGRLCSMASLPYPFPAVDSDLRRRGELSVKQINDAKNEQGRTLIACGEYNTKGSLEMYGLTSENEGRSYANTGAMHNSTMKNRQTASNSKLLSVINHGTRIVYSDGQGCVKWTERDGFTQVRRHHIGSAERTQERSLFASMPGSDEIARKLLSTQTGDIDRCNDDDILFWTGEQLGLIGFSSQPGSAAEDFEEQSEEEKNRRLYDDEMRRALERQANDVRFARYLGAGIGNGV